MRKQELMTKVLGNKIVSEVGKFYLAHESTILTGGTIGFSMATTAVTYRNADKIKAVLKDAGYILQDLKQQNAPKEQINEFYKQVLKELAPLIVPIMIFQIATIATACVSKKKADKKIAEAAGALSIAQAAIAQYQSFQKEAEEALGEEKYEKLQKDIYKKQDIDCRRYTISSEGDPGQTLYVDKYSGRPFWSYSAQVEYAAKEMGRRLSSEGGYDYQSINDFYELVDNPDLGWNEMARYFGYSAGEEPSVHFTDTHVIFPNGTRVQAAMVYLYPEPDYIG